MAFDIIISPRSFGGWVEAVSTKLTAFPPMCDVWTDANFKASKKTGRKHDSPASLMLLAQFLRRDGDMNHPDPTPAIRGSFGPAVSRVDGGAVDFSSVLGPQSGSEVRCACGIRSGLLPTDTIVRS